MAGVKKSPRNYLLGKSGVMRWSASAAFGKKAKYKWAKAGQKKKAPAAKPKTVVEKKIGGEKNGGTRMVQAKKMVSAAKYLVYQTLAQLVIIVINQCTSHSHHFFLNKVKFIVE